MEKIVPFTQEQEDAVREVMQEVFVENKYINYHWFCLVAEVQVAVERYLESRRKPPPPQNWEEYKKAAVSENVQKQLEYFGISKIAMLSDKQFEELVEQLKEFVARTGMGI